MISVKMSILSIDTIQKIKKNDITFQIIVENDRRYWRNSLKKGHHWFDADVTVI